MEIVIIECWGPSPSQVAVTATAIGWAGRYVARWSRWTVLVSVPLLLLQLEPIFPSMAWAGSRLMLLWSLEPMLAAPLAIWCLLGGLSLPRLEARATRSTAAALALLLAALLFLAGRDLLWPI